MPHPDRLAQDLRPGPSRDASSRLAFLCSRSHPEQPRVATRPLSFADERQGQVVRLWVARWPEGWMDSGRLVGGRKDRSPIQPIGLMREGMKARGPR